jgi:hypothetical protein
MFNSKYDYYESYGKFREYGSGDHHFVFDLKIEKNNRHNFNSDQPGTSVIN